MVEIGLKPSPMPAFHKYPSHGGNTLLLYREGAASIALPPFAPSIPYFLC